MKNIFLLLLFIGTLLNVNAQPPAYDDLVVLFADGNYEKLLKKAEKYTQSDKTKKHAIPYLFLAKGNYEIAREGGDLLEKYPKAGRDALKYAGKCISKDKDGTVYKDNLAFFTTLKNSIIEEIRNLVDTQEWSKISGKLLAIQKVDKQDIGVHYLAAAKAYYTKDRKKFASEAKLANEMLKNADPSKFTINEDDDVDINEKKKADLEMLKIGVIAYAEALIIAKQEQKAKDIMGKIAQWYENDTEFKAKYDEIVN
ncbi:MAG TPA: hypothetical protein EYG85_06375 [Crocinitomix sp.]|nr:hypothetical protein [Crocinitomix sp.]